MVDFALRQQLLQPVDLGPGEIRIVLQFNEPGLPQALQGREVCDLVAVQLKQFHVCHPGQGFQVTDLIPVESQVLEGCHGCQGRWIGDPVVGQAENLQFR